MNPTDSMDGLMLVLISMVAASTLFVVGAGLCVAGQAYDRWRFNRRMRNLPPPADPRLVNVVSLMDWKHRERAEKRFRSVA